MIKDLLDCFETPPPTLLSKVEGQGQNSWDSDGNVHIVLTHLPTFVQHKT